MKLMRLALTGSLLLVLAACGNDSPVNPPTNPNPPTDPGMPANPPGGLPGGIPGLPGGGVPNTPPAGNGLSGTITAPGGASASGTIVIVCAQSDAECASAQTTIADTAGAYSFINLQATPYLVIAVQDVDSNNDFNVGDNLGFYTTDGTNPATVTPPATGVNITMTVYNDGSGGSGTPTTPTDPGTGGSISGTLLPPGTVAGSSAVVALYLTGDESDPFDTDLSGVAEIPASSGSNYSVAGLSAGQYLVVAYSDADGNGSDEDANDYVGIYPSFDAPEAVSPPDTGIDIPMITNTEFDALSTQSIFKTKALRAAGTSLNDYLLDKQLEQALKAFR